MSNQPIRYGVLALGRSGWNIHVANLRNRSDAQIVAVADPDAARREQAVKELNCQAYTNLQDMLQNPEIEVVVIATPSFLHAADTAAVFKAGKHVVVEKPMSMNVAQADEMIQNAKNAGKKLLVHHNLRFSRELTHLKQVMDSGLIGKVYHIRMYLSSFSRRNDWQTLAKNGGGQLNNTCTHFLDQALYLINSPITKVMGDLKQIASSGDVEDHVKAFLKAENGITLDMEISTAQAVEPALPKWILCGSCGTLTSDGKKAIIKRFDPTKVQPLPVVDAPAADRKYGNDDVLPWETIEQEIVGPDIGTFYDNVYAVLRDNKPMHVTPESVRELMRVVELIRTPLSPPLNQSL